MHDFLCLYLHMLLTHCIAFYMYMYCIYLCTHTYTYAHIYTFISIHPAGKHVMILYRM